MVALATTILIGGRGRGKKPNSKVESVCFWVYEYARREESEQLSFEY